MIFKVMGRKYELHYAIRKLGIDFETMTAKQIFNIMLDKCGYRHDEKINVIDDIYTEIYSTNKCVELLKINSNVKMDELIIDGKRYDNLKYVYDCNERESYIYVNDFKRIEYPSIEIEQTAKNTFNELNKLIEQRNLKIKEAE